MPAALRWAALAGVVLLGAPGGTASTPYTTSALAVRGPAGWTTFWRASDAPARWTGPNRSVVQAIRWHAGEAGYRWGELELSGSGEAWRTRAVVVELDPGQLQLELANGVAPGGSLAVWSVDRAPGDALVAFNTGQFNGAAVWGWVVHAGVEYRAPGRGPLATAVVIAPDGSVHFENDSAVAARRAAGSPRHPAGVREAFQSYPTLLTGDGAVPLALRQPDLPIDLAHRDARLALGQLPNGHLLVLLTRFDALGSALGGVPFGLTVPELAGLMGALGCRHAVALDGGVSGQLLVRDSAGAHRWTGLRRVPLGLVVRRDARDAVIPSERQRVEGSSRPTRRTPRATRSSQ